MKKLISLVVLALAFVLPSYAQTTYKSTVSMTDGTRLFGVFHIGGQTLVDSAGTGDSFTVDWLDAQSNYACSGQPKPDLGFIFYHTTAADGTVTTPPCTPVTALSFGPLVTVNTTYNGRVFSCTDYSSVHIEFGGKLDNTGVLIHDTYDALLEPFYKPTRYAGCYREIVSVSATLY